MEDLPNCQPRSLAFGLDRISIVALGRPRLVALIFALVTAVTVYGFAQVSVDRDLRNLFQGETEIFRAYSEAAELYVDPENQILILVEGDSLREPLTLLSLRDLHLELSLLPDVGSVFSLFSLRTPPDENGRARPLIDDPAAGLDAELVAAVRKHPILGSNLLAADGSSLVMFVTHAETKAPLNQHADLIAEVRATVAAMVGEADVETTITGFAPMRTEIIRLVERDQVVLNGSGVIIGFLLCLILFRSLGGAAMTAVPAAFAGLTLLGWMGALGLHVTILSSVVPTLVMVLGYADCMHLTAAQHQFRRQGLSAVDAERLALIEVGPACLLTALTTAATFLSLTLSDVGIVQDFGWVGAAGTVFGTTTVLVGHGLGARLAGRFSQIEGRASINILGSLAGPSAALTRWVTARGWPIAIVSMPVMVLLGAAFFSVPPEYSLGEMLPADNRIVHALHMIDEELGGAFPVQIIVPIDGIAADSPEGLARIRAVHEAVATVETASPPLSLWSLAQWAGATAGETAAILLSDLPEATQRLFLAEPGAMVAVNIVERPTAETVRVIEAIEAAAQSAVPEAVVTGATVVGARESMRTIANLNRGLGLAVVVALSLVAVAVRSVGAGLAAAIPNLLPIVGIGAILNLLGSGMQLTSVVSLTIAFGIAIDDTIHYLNALYFTRSGDLNARLVDASRQVGPVLVGTTFAIVAGMLMTQTSGLATVALFGLLTTASLAIALVGDLVLLPAIIAGPLRRRFRFGETRRVHWR